MRRQNTSFYSIRGLEKLCYIIGFPSLLAYGGYVLYKKNVSEADERANYIKGIEDKYLEKHSGNLIKL
jgi:hypothetical protein